MTADPRDRIILEHAPLVAVPRYGNFEPLQTDGHRILAAADGLWLELRRPWLHLTWPIAESAMPLPYGEMLGDEIHYAWSDEDLQMLISRFTADAVRELPNECAAWGVWNENTQALEYRPLIATSASPGGVTFARPQLAPHEHLAVDIHSHGRLPAFFSATDDADDAGAVKLSIVIGELNADECSYGQRLCVLGLMIGYSIDGNI
jgi:PRTRC genetic system protein A